MKMIAQAGDSFFELEIEGTEQELKEVIQNELD